MDYISGNKIAWEEAFDNRHEGWGDDLAQRLTTEELPFLNPMLRQAMQSLDLRGKAIAQFCCNNGREILSVMQLKPRSGVGFDIAENMIASARQVAARAKLPCAFAACDILKIGAEYDKAFDFVFFTIGAITWFEDLKALFAVAARCLKPGGLLMINDFHPLVNMLPLPGEAEYDPAFKNRIVFPYFRSEPWIEHNSGGYMTDHQNTDNTFTSFSHTMGGILNALIDNGFRIASLREFDKDIGMTDVYDGQSFPMSYILLADMPAPETNR